MKKAEAIETAEPALITDPRLAPIIRIGTETVLSQFPIHKLSKGKEPLEIRFTKTNPRGKVTTVWKVSPSRDYGEPGILAYRIDTLIINRLIDQERPAVPEVIRLGSLRDICQQLGITEGKNTKLVKDALYQNAFAGITAKLEYKGIDGTERSFEFGSTRYAVVFTGERLPDGRRADAVYVILHPLFREVMHHAKTRPLDYNYLRMLKPSAQRLYELISPQIFAAIKRGNDRAKYYYSDFCKYAPLTRFFEWDQVRPQMARVHREHIESGYVSKVGFEVTKDEMGRIDWVMLYTPGKKAHAEFREFNKRRENQERTAEEKRPRLLAVNRRDELDEKGQGIFDQLLSYGVGDETAYRLIKDDQEEVERQINAFPSRKLDGIENPAGLLIAAIRNKYAIPQPISSAEVKTATKRKADAEAKRKEEARTKIQGEFSPEYFDEYLRPIRDRLREINAEAFTVYQTRCSRIDEFSTIEEEHRERFKLWDLEEMSKSWPELEILTFWDWMKATHADRLKGLGK